MISLRPFSSHREENEKNKADSPYESCICCHHPTDQLKADTLWQRKYYVEGAGQLCRQCYDRIYSNMK